MSFQIVKGDIFKQRTDAIVLTTSPKLTLEGSLGQKALDICGDVLQLELNQLNNPAIGECRITNSYNLRCERIIHVATPKWDKSNKKTREFTLASCYRSCMEKAIEFGLTSISFPLLSSGAYECPAKTAIRIAIDTINDFLDDPENDLEVVLVIYKKKTWDSYRPMMQKYLVGDGETYETTEEELREIGKEQRGFGWYSEDTERILDNPEKAKTIRERIIYMMNLKGISTYKDCYDGIISKTGFANILSAKSKVPNKYTLVSIGLKMGLDVSEINFLTAPLGERFDPFENDKDRIIMSRFDELERTGDYIEVSHIIEEINKTLAKCHFSILPVSKD